MHRRTNPTRVAAVRAARPRTSLRHLVLLVAAAVLSLSAATPDANAQTAIDYVHPRASRTQLMDFMRSLGVERGERIIIEMVFDEYMNAYTDLVKQTDEAAIAAGRDRVIAARSGRTRLDRETLFELRVNVLNAYRASWDEAERLVDELIDRTLVMAPSPAPAGATEALRKLRRQMYLHPFQAQRTDFGYAGEGLDLSQLIEESRSEGGSLANVNDTQINEIIEKYRADIDVIVEDIARKRREAQLDARIAWLREDEQDIADAEAALMQLWSQQHALHDDVVTRVGELAAAASGVEARRQWITDYHRDCYPWLFREQKPDRAYTWLLKNSLSEDERSNIESAFHAYMHERSEVAGKIVEVIRRARLEEGRALHPGLDARSFSGHRTMEELHLTMLRLTGDMESVERRANDAFASAVSAELRAKLRSTVR